MLTGQSLYEMLCSRLRHVHDWHDDSIHTAICKGFFWIRRPMMQRPSRDSVYIVAAKGLPELCDRAGTDSIEIFANHRGSSDGAAAFDRYPSLPSCFTFAPEVLRHGSALRRVSTSRSLPIYETRNCVRDGVMTETLLSLTGPSTPRDMRFASYMYPSSLCIVTGRHRYLHAVWALPVMRQSARAVRLCCSFPSPWWRFAVLLLSPSLAGRSSWLMWHS